MRRFNNNNPIALQTELSMVSRGLGRDDVSTEFYGDGAWTNGKHINLPAMPLTGKLNDNQMRTMRGYHIHELSHVLNTDHRYWRRAKNVDDQLRRTWNAMEDVFIERKINEEFAGAQKNLVATVQAVLESELPHIRTSARDWSELPYVVLQASRKAMGYDTEALDEYLDSVPEPIMTEALKYVPDAIACESTKDTIKVARKLHKAMAANEGQEFPPLDDQQSGQQGEQGESGDVQGDETIQGDGQGSGTGQGSDEQGDGNEDGESKGGNGQGSGQGGATETYQFGGDEKAAEIINEIARDVTEQSGGERPRYVPTPDKMEHEPVYDKIKRRVTDEFGDEWTQAHEDGWHVEAVKRYDAMVASAGGALRKRAGSLARVLNSQENEYWVGGLEQGRLDRNRIVGVLHNERNIFAERVLDVTRSTVIHVLMDTSGSMSDEPKCQALAFINEALKRTQVRYKLSLWSSGGEVWCVKNYDDRGVTDATKRNIDNARRYGGGTSPAPAMMAGYADTLTNTHEERKIVLFCSDACFSNIETDTCRDLTAWGESMGLECYGVLIDAQDGGEFASIFPSGCVNTDSANLADSLLGQLEKLLRKGAQIAAA